MAQTIRFTRAHDPTQHSTDCHLHILAQPCIVLHAFPAHQHVIALDRSYVTVDLTAEEIAQENRERLSRFDYMRFLPSLYDPAKILMRWGRKLFGWSLRDQYLRNEIEIIALHEQELLDTRSEENSTEVEFELDELRRQKRDLLRELKR